MFVRITTHLLLAFFLLVLGLIGKAQAEESPLEQFDRLFPKCERTGPGSSYPRIMRVDNCRVIVIPASRYIYMILVTAQTKGKAQTTAQQLVKLFAAHNPQAIAFYGGAPSYVILFPFARSSEQQYSSPIRFLDQFFRFEAPIQRISAILREKNIKFTGWQGRKLKVVADMPSYKKRKQQVEMYIDLTRSNLPCLTFRPVGSVANLSNDDIFRFVSTYCYNNNYIRPASYLSSTQESDLKKACGTSNIIGYTFSQGYESDKTFDTWYAIVKDGRQYRAGSVHAFKTAASNKDKDTFPTPKIAHNWPATDTPAGTSSNTTTTPKQADTTPEQPATITPPPAAPLPLNDPLPELANPPSDTLIHYLRILQMQATSASDEDAATKSVFAEPLSPANREQLRTVADSVIKELDTWDPLRLSAWLSEHTGLLFAPDGTSAYRVDTTIHVADSGAVCFVNYKDGKVYDYRKVCEVYKLSSHSANLSDFHKPHVKKVVLQHYAPVLASIRQATDKRFGVNTLTDHVTRELLKALRELPQKSRDAWLAERMGLLYLSDGSKAISWHIDGWKKASGDLLFMDSNGDEQHFKSCTSTSTAKPWARASHCSRLADGIWERLSICLSTEMQAIRDATAKRTAERQDKANKR